MDQSPSAASPLEDLARATARRALFPTPNLAPNLREYNRSERKRYLDQVVSNFASEHGVSVADAYDIFLEMVLDWIREWTPTGTRSAVRADSDSRSSS